MTENSKGPVPTEINLHRKSRLLNIAFSDGKTFSLPCEYLRVNSHSAEVRTRGTPEFGKENVNIDSIEPQGSYAIRIAFDDGHDTGIYSWETLYELGVNQEANWQAYLDKLAAAGYDRSGQRLAGASDAERKVKLMYFAYLANKMGKEAEEVKPPDTVETVEQLLGWLQRVKGDRGYLFNPEYVRITVNKQFAEPFTKLDPGDEIAIVPNSPNPPPAPQQPKRSNDDW
ncbi:gamma-butyrobetaine hydroxylase-like domain-containing protein [Thiosocius teredinicola]|uniref:gamma-butyrobetaine hydroxylase-like domain-containing protein n=1 Tax=Thiosocius teredinicola TaxID=1973002 RepID=UPI000990B8D6